MGKIFICPHCGEEIDASYIASSMGKKGGKAKTAKKLSAQQSNMAKLNAAYTPEKRKAAAQKRLATLAAKKAAEGK